MRRVLAHDPDQLQFVLDIRSAERDRGNLWIVSTRLQKFLRRTLNSNEINLRIMKVTGPPQLPPPAPYSNLLHYKKWLTPQKRDSSLDDSLILLCTWIEFFQFIHIRERKYWYQWLIILCRNTIIFKKEGIYFINCSNIRSLPFLPTTFSLITSHFRSIKFRF